MEIQGSKSALTAALASAARIAARKSTLPILANALISAEGEHVAVSATDLTTSVSTRCAVKVTASGSITLEARKLHEVVRGLPDQPITIKVTDGNRAEIRCGKSRYAISGMAAGEFPRLPKVPDASVSVPGVVLAALIEHTLFSALEAMETDPSKSGCLLEADGESLSMVSTDSHRLSLVRRKLPGAPKLATGMLLPRSSLAEIAKLVEDLDAVSLGIGERHVFVTAGQTVIASALIQAAFPPYRQVVDPSVSGVTRSVVTDRSALLDAVQRMNAVVNEKSKSVSMSVGEWGIRLSSDSPDGSDGSEELAGEFTGKEISVGLNARYLSEALQHIAGNDVYIGFGATELHPVVLHSTPETDGGLLNVMMPLRR